MIRALTRMFERSQRWTGVTRAELLVSATLLFLSLCSLCYRWFANPDDPLNTKLKARIAFVIDSLSRVDSLRTQRNRETLSLPEDEDALSGVSTLPVDTVSPIRAASGYAKKLGPKQKIDIRQCSAQELQQIPGIGPTLARRIVDYRLHHPLFQLEQLRDVKGIGSVLYKKITPWMRLERVQDRKSVGRKP